MQALLAAFDRRGFAVRISDKNETFVTVMEETFQIALVERLAHTPEANVCLKGTQPCRSSKASRWKRE